MTGRYKAYPEYKLSNNFELGYIPSHWGTSKVRYVSYCLDGRRIPLNGTERGEMQGSVPYWGANSVVDHINEYIFDEDLVLLGEDGAPFFDTTKNVAFFVQGKVWPNNHVHVLRPEGSKVNAKFLTYALNCVDYHLYITGSTRDKLNQSAMNDIALRICSLEEQQKIANFLDFETAKIDTLIAKQEKLIELLKEKRQALISHAVTKGLNAQVPMKDSGVEWLGAVPEHWQIVPLKYLCTFSGGGTPTKDNLSYWTNGTVPWVSPKDMKSFWIDKTQDNVTERAIKESSTNIVDEGALLMVVRSGILQRTIPIAINTVPVTMNQDMKALKFNDRIDVQYAAGFILGSVDSLLLDWSKDGATVESIEYEYLANGLFPVPPKQEQQAIISFINKQQSTFQTLEDKALVGIKLLSERRTALISAAVTGKIDVRNLEQPND
ncbi:restriction endonuclease subunit S [Pseudoalteromonas sp. Angola-7]|uniref:restriction endonuclease subunit S n=1 Tax=Pseudoalteromonas sp. Angola-7 TaxID=3025336 RepID=UPI00235962F4|nr:restriction endonuclease subunit S [Pseudoalteromonas sp. Angola-7]MDC9530533.1 restriction endonuclease subunit S [Pseudoalteromonas sp. Angola-7]